METPFVSLGFTKLADANLVIKTEAILTGLTSNPNYVTPTPTLTIVSQAAVAFQQALTAAEDGAS